MGEIFAFHSGARSSPFFIHLFSIVASLFHKWHSEVSESLIMNMTSHEPEGQNFQCLRHLKGYSGNAFSNEIKLSRAGI